MKFYIIAGEASGDLHASNLIKEFKALQPGSEFRAWGGDKMQEAGAELSRHYESMAFMGFVEVVKNLSAVREGLDFCKKDLSNYDPDVLILVDYPGFNMRMARFAKNLRCKVLYYISPQVWAWKKGRVHQLKKLVDDMFVILPFEQKFYEEMGMGVHYVGHPLLDAIEQYKAENESVEYEKNLVALLPGSRNQEIRKMLPIMMEVVDKSPELNFAISCAPGKSDEIYAEFIGNREVELYRGHTYSLLRRSEAALVTSGTATLETALWGVPQVVCYKGNAASVWIARRLVNIEFISLVNLIMGREVVTELIQSDLSSARLLDELQKLFKPEYRKKVQDDYKSLVEILGGAGASNKTATLMLKTLKGPSA